MPRYRKWSDDDLKIAVKNSRSIRQVLQKIGLIQTLLKNDSRVQSFKLKKRLFEEKIKMPVCEMCGWAKISLDGRIPVKLDHVNGNRNDNRIENLRILCPNCHSLQLTHRGKNKKKN